jgi:hypothetical protein
MMLITFAFLTSFAFGVAIKPNEEDYSAVIGPVSPVRPDWTNVPQGDRVLPRLQTARFVVTFMEYLWTILMCHQNSRRCKTRGDPLRTMDSSRGTSTE